MILNDKNRGIWYRCIDLIKRNTSLDEYKTKELADEIMRIILSYPTETTAKEDFATAYKATKEEENEPKRVSEWLKAKVGLPDSGKILALICDKIVIVRRSSTSVPWVLDITGAPAGRISYWMEIPNFHNRKVVNSFIDTCSGCGYMEFGYPSNGPKVDEVHICGKERKELTNYDTIPKWCPLEDECL